MAALIAAPAFGQSTTSPGAGPTPSNSPGMSPSTSPNTRQPTDQGRSDMKGQRGKGSDMSQGSSTQGTSGTQDSAGRDKSAGNSQVRQVQEALKAQGHDPGPIDGVMGPQTQQAIREYQKSQNLSETGRIDAQTAQKLGVGGGMGGSGTGTRGTGSGSSTGGTSGR